MNITAIILSLGLISAVFTSLIASYIHRKKWHRRNKKSAFLKINLCLSSFYQFNAIFYNPFSFIRELMINTMFISLSFKYLICEHGHLQFRCLIGLLILTIIYRSFCQLIVYSKFYDEELVK